MKTLLDNGVFAFHAFLFVCLNSIALSAQCPSFTNSTFNAGCIGTGSPCTLCADQTITLHAVGTNLPNPGCVKWYYSQTSGFNPYNNEGTLIGCGTIVGNNSANVIFNTTDAMCNNGAYYVVGIIDPLDQTSCPQVFTSEFSFQVDCPIATISAIDSPYCERYPIHFYATGGVSYHWEGPPVVGQFTSNEQNPVIPYAVSLAHNGIFYVTVTDAIGCKVVKSKNIYIWHLWMDIQPFPPENVTFCHGGSGDMFATIWPGQGNNYTINGWYTWDPNCLLPCANPVDSFLTLDPHLVVDKTSWYVYAVTDNETGCQGVTVKGAIELPPLIVKINPNPLQLCQGGTASATVSCNNGLSPYSYLWSSGETTATIQIHEPGFWKATVTDANGCTGQDSITVEPGIPPDLSISVPANIFCPNTSIPIKAIASGGITPYIYNWTTPGGPLSGQIINSNITGIYLVTVTDNIGCTDTASVLIVQNPDIVLNITPNPAIICYGGNVTLIALATGGSGGNYVYKWTTPSGVVTNSTIVATVSGNYTVTVTDGEGCKKSGSVSVQVENVMVAINPDPAEFCPGGSIILNTLNSGGMGNYNYNWSTPDGIFNSETLSVNTYGSYFVTITDENGCTAKDNIEVKPKPDILVSLNVLPPVICNNDSVQITATAMGGSSTNYTFDWSTPSGQKSGASLITSIPGNYIITVTDGGFCSKIDSIKVTISDISIAINPNPASICNNGSIPLTATASGGTGKNFQYSWTTPAGPKTGNIITADVAGTYSVTVSDSGGCFKETSIVVTSTTSLEVNINPDPAGFCTGASVDLTAHTNGGTGIYTYQWTTPGGNSSKDTISTSVKGAYSITVTDSNGCSGTASTIVNEYANPDINLIAVPSGFCPGTTVQITAGSTDPSILSYDWTTPAGMQLGDKINAGVEGNYYVTVTNNYGCTAIVSIYIKEYPEVEVSINPDPASFCVGSSVQLSASSSAVGTIDYIWNTPSGTKAGNAILATTAGTYIVTAGNSNGCTASDTVMVTQVSSIPVTIDPSNPGFCTGANVELTANASGSKLVFDWSTPSGNKSGQVINVNQAGSYSVTVTDEGGCTGTATIVVNEYPLLDIFIDPNPASFCNSGSVLLTANNKNGTAPFSYEWNTPIGSGANQNFNANTTGQYIVTVTDAHGCSGTASSQVQQSNSLTVNILPTQPGFCPGKTVDLSSTANGGQLPYSYTWNSPIGIINYSSFTTNTAGNYELTVTDSNGCSGTATIQVEEYASPIISLPASYGFCKGSSVIVKAKVIDVLTPILFSWNTPSGASTLDSILATQAGIYYLTVSNAAGCEASTNTIVNEWPLPVISFDPDPVQFCIGGSIDIKANVTTGQNPFNYQWQGPLFNSANNPISITNIGTYYLTVTDANACSGSSSITATEAPGLNVMLTTDPAVICDLQQFNILSQVTGGNQPYTYNWQSPKGNYSTANISVSSFDKYELTVTDSKGCSGTADITPLDQSLQVELDKTDPGCIALKSGSITLTSVINASYPIQLKLDNHPAVSITGLPYILQSLQAGNYQLTLIANNGCEKVFNLELTAPSTPDLKLGDDVTIFLGESYTIIPTANFLIDSIKWTNKSSLECTPGCVEPVASPQFSTTYKATAYSKDGCKATDDINIYVVEKESVYIPNSFSPNGDGINDQWLVFTDQTVKQIKKMYIYDRWGEAIFLQENFPPNDPAYGWNGKFRNQLMNDAVFVFYVQVEFNDGRVKEYKGDVNLLR